jgi:ribosomal protein S27E
MYMIRQIGRTKMIYCVNSPFLHLSLYMRICNKLNGNSMDFVFDRTSTEVSIICLSELCDDCCKVMVSRAGGKRRVSVPEGDHVNRI